MKACKALVPSTSVMARSASILSDPGNILVIDGSPCADCVPTSAQYSPDYAVDDNGSTVATINYLAAQAVSTTNGISSAIPASSMYSVPTAVATALSSVTDESFHPGVIVSAEDTASATGHYSAQSSSKYTLLPYESTLTASYKKTSEDPAASTSTTTSKSGATQMAQVDQFLRWSLAMYTVTFTLFLLPPPSMGRFEFLFIFATMVIGWTFLYFDFLKEFISNPGAKVVHLRNQFQGGVIMYVVERWNTFQLIRQRNITTSAYFATRVQPRKLTQPKSFLYRGNSSLGAWWKSDILKSLKSHDLRDYVHNYSLEKYLPATPTVTSPRMTTHQQAAPMKTRVYIRNEDDIFSSDEELDVSPLTTKRPRASNPLVLLRGPQSNADISGESKKTCVDTDLSPREKVSGFIPWAAMKRESAEMSGQREAERALDRMQVERTPTEESGSSWEREALGAAI